jgi:hypothetical protein
VSSCNNELETLITDANRSVAVYAITTLLKTGSEASVDRVLKQIRTFMTDIPDDFKARALPDSTNGHGLKEYRTLIFTSQAASRHRHADMPILHSGPSIVIQCILEARCALHVPGAHRPCLQLTASAL